MTQCFWSPSAFERLMTDVLREDVLQREAKPQGSWIAVLAQRNGKPAKDVVGHRLSCFGDRFIIRAGDGQRLYQGFVTVNATASPATIDFRHTEGALKGRTWKGIFALEADTLTICDNAPNLARDRPRSFDAGADSGYISIAFRRGKK
jgi:uncharacterized protein (TIGR03067 family)